MNVKRFAELKDNWRRMDAAGQMHCEAARGLLAKGRSFQAALAFENGIRCGHAPSAFEGGNLYMAQSRKPNPDMQDQALHRATLEGLALTAWRHGMMEKLHPGCALALGKARLQQPMKSQDPERAGALLAEARMALEIAARRGGLRIRLAARNQIRRFPGDLREDAAGEEAAHALLGAHAETRHSLQTVERILKKPDPAGKLALGILCIAGIPLPWKRSPADLGATEVERRIQEGGAVHMGIKALQLNPHKASDFLMGLEPDPEAGRQLVTDAATAGSREADRLAKYLRKELGPEPPSRIPAPSPMLGQNTGIAAGPARRRGREIGA